MESVRQLKYFNDSIWYYYSLLSCLPLLAIVVLKYRSNIPYMNYLNKTLPRDTYDPIVYVLIFFSTYYYIFDTIFKFMGKY